MEKYPLTLKSGKECAILEGFGQRTSLLIDQKLAALASEMKCSVEEALNSENERLIKLREINKKKRKRMSRKRPVSEDNPIVLFKNSPEKQSPSSKVSQFAFHFA